MSLQFSGKHFACVLFLVLFGTSSASQVHGAAPVLPILVYNYAAVSPSTLAYSEAEAERLLRRGGVNVAWYNCLSHEDCNGATTQNGVVLRLVAGSNRELNSNVLGFALPSEGGRMATVFYDRAVDLRQTGVFVYQILGKVIAHEVAHLLLGENAHTPMGVMRPRWTPGSFSVDGEAGLYFTRRQAATLQREVLRRSTEVYPTEVNP